MSLQFKDKYVVRDNVKCFAQIQVDDISYSSLTHQCCNPVVEGHQICQARFACSEAMLAVTNHFFVSKCLGIVSRRISSMILLGTEGRLTALYFPGSSFLPFLKMGVMFPLFQSVGTSLDCNDFSNMMDSGLATSSASWLGTRGCTSSGRMDLCTCRFLRWSQTRSSPYSGLCFILPVPAFAICDLGGVAGALAGEDWGKKVTKYLSLLHIPGNQVSHFLPQWTHIFASIFFIADVPIADVLWCSWPDLILSGLQLS